MLFLGTFKILVVSIQVLWSISSVVIYFKIVVYFKYFFQVFLGTILYCFLLSIVTSEHAALLTCAILSLLLCIYLISPLNSAFLEPSGLAEYPLHTKLSRLQGDELYADGIIVEASGLTTNEAALTGESDDVKKNTTAMPFVYSGTQVMDGVGKYVCVLYLSWVASAGLVCIWEEKRGGWGGGGGG